MTKRTLLLLAGSFLMLLQVFKGLSLESLLYPVATAIPTYADGPVRRALLPTLYHFLGIRDVAALLNLHTHLHYVWLALLAATLLLAFTRRLAGGSEARRDLFLLMLTSPLLTLLAATGGYADPLLVALLVVVSECLRRGRACMAALILTAAMLQHEMVLVLGLPLFLAEALLQPAHRRATLTAAGAVAGLGALWLAVTALHQPEIYSQITARCAALRPEWHPKVVEVWDVYCERQTRGSLASDFTPLRLTLLPFYALVYGLFPLLAFLGGYGQIRREKQGARGVFLLGLMFAPLSLIAIAWDADRFFILTIVTAWLVLDRWLETSPPPASLSRPALGVLLLFQIALYVPAVDVYAVRRAVPPSLEARMLIDPRLWTFPFMESLGLRPMPQLDPANCVDTRCAQ